MGTDAVCPDGSDEVVELVLDLVAEVLMNARGPLERARLVRLLVDQACDMSALLDPGIEHEGALRNLRRAAARHVDRVRRCRTTAV